MVLSSRERFDLELVSGVDSANLILSPIKKPVIDQRASQSRVVVRLLFRNPINTGIQAADFKNKPFFEFLRCGGDILFAQDIHQLNFGLPESIFGQINRYNRFTYDAIGLISIGIDYINGRPFIVGLNHYIDSRVGAECYRRKAIIQ